jgi:hypothetical protein
MKTFLSTGFAMFLLLGSSFAVQAQDGGKKGKQDPATQMVTQFIKQLEKAELSEDQTAKVKEIMTKVAKDVTSKRTEAGITPEMMKKRVEARKKATEDGKKGKELKELVEASGDFSADQKKVFEETELLLNKARIEVGKLIPPEQTAKLPAIVQANLKEKKTKKNK